MPIFTFGPIYTFWPKVKIGNNCKIQNNAYIPEGVTIGSGVFIGPGVTFTNIKVPKASVSQKSKFVSTTICDGVTIGANATILCGLYILDRAFIGAGSVVTKTVDTDFVVYGNPAKMGRIKE